METTKFHDKNSLGWGGRCGLWGDLFKKTFCIMQHMYKVAYF